MTDTSPLDTPISEEDMMNVIGQLSELKASKPDVFKKLLGSLGMGEETDLFANGEESVRRMTESIMKMRGESKDSGNDSNITMSKDGKQQPKGITITPTAGFSIKTVLITDSNGVTNNKPDERLKVFINLTQHEEIAKPGMKKKLNDEGEEVEGMNIPMSVGLMHLEADNKGADCYAYDIIVNETVIEEAQSDITGKYRDFLCQLAMQCVEQKHKVVLDKRYKLPKLKYCGKTILSQYIQDRKNMPSIVEVSSENNPVSGSSNTGKKTNVTGVKAKTSSKVMEIADSDLIYQLSWLQSKSDALSTTNTIAPSVLLSSDYNQTPITHSVNEYVDPIQEPPTNCNILIVNIQMTSEQAILFQSQYNSNNNQTIQISPYRLVINLPYYKKSTLYLPHCVLPTSAQAHLVYPSDGYVTKMELLIILPLDLSEYANDIDAGSKPWLVAQALSQDDTTSSSLGGSNPYLTRLRDESTIGKGSTAGDAKKDDTGTLPEDKFHIKLPDDVDKYTGVKMDQRSEKDLIEAMDGKVTMKQPWQDNEEAELLPEDRFHQKDASSSYLINQREQAKKDKWDKYEKEKAERKHDPNVEYVEMDDFRPGGKYADEKTKTGRDLAALAAAGGNSESNETLRKAATIVASNQELPVEGLKSTLWSELL